MAQQNQPDVSPAEIEDHLGGVDYPAGKQDLKQHAQQKNAPNEVVETIDQIPDQEYNSPTDVAQGVGKVE